MDSNSAIERTKKLFDSVTDILSVREDILNNKVFLTEEQVTKINELEKWYPELVIGHNEDTNQYSISTFSLLSTLSCLLCGKRMYFKMDSETKKIIGVGFLDEGRQTT